ncbi:hypothetical protein ACGFJC_18025 [Nonomuraea fuscirosea]|uniref:hypothetical protein n=1 Tax=Nonomuraea fuscirosea TaxID=1291556 RepID=UPI003476FBA0
MSTPSPSTSTQSPGPSQAPVPAPAVTVVSPCPHTPTCPPPACLPPSLRPSASPAPSQPTSSKPASGQKGDGAKGGYEAVAGSIDKFAGSISGAAQGVNQVKEYTPRFEGVDLAPLAGVPLVGLMFVNRFNRISDSWKDSAGILHNLLQTDSGKIAMAANNYRNAERPGGGS